MERCWRYVVLAKDSQRLVLPTPGVPVMIIFGLLRVIADFWCSLCVESALAQSAKSEAVKKVANAERRVLGAVDESLTWLLQIVGPQTESAETRLEPFDLAG